MRVKMTIAYDGKAYCGFQKQKNGVSVQSVIERALTDLIGKETSVVASGRTDAGVHALGQVCHFDLDACPIPTEKIEKCLNAILPDDVRVLSCERAQADFHARYSAKRKTYSYGFYISGARLPFFEDKYYALDALPDFSLMRAAADALTGKRDFKCFCAANSSVKDTVREIYSIDIIECRVKGVMVLDVRVCGNGFLYKMVRTLCGQLIAVGFGKMSIETLKSALDAQNRNILEKTLPAKALTLLSVEYD